MKLVVVVEQILGDQTYSELNSSSLKNKNVSDSIIKEYFKGGTIELAIQDCPKLLQKGKRGS